MSQSDLAISVRGLSKSYTIAHNGEKHTRLGEKMMARLRNPLHRPQNETFWALKDVNFDVKRGEVVGIIGRNGAGKSTLLKILSRITEPTKGEIKLYGRVASLLEVGTGFHPELTGRENIFLNGAILGMRKTEIARKFDEIVAFSETEKFLDTPVKRYSSGMYVRLAFAVAAHLEPEILIVDEVLAVGDGTFQRKCIDRMKKVSSEGRTVLVVSHNMDVVQRICDSAILLEQGESRGHLPVSEGVKRYFGRSQYDESGQLADRPRIQHHQRPHIFKSLQIKSQNGQGSFVRTGDEIVFEIEMRDFEDVRNALCHIAILDEGFQRVVMFHSLYHSNMSLGGSSQMRLQCIVPSLPLVPGRYVVEVALADGQQIIEKVEQAAEIEVTYSDILKTGRLPSYTQGRLVLPASWETIGS